MRKTSGKKPKSKDLDQMISILEANIRILRNVKRLSVTKSMDAHLYPHDVKRSIKDAKKILVSENPDRDIQFNLDLDDEIYINCDDFIQDIWLNIFRNILKFDKSKKCRIDIGWDINIRGDDTNILVKVADHGPGIPDKEKKLIFGREERGTATAKGTGLGLFVVNRLMEYYGGRIWVENRVKKDHTKGSVFCLEFTTPQEEF